MPSNFWDQEVFNLPKENRVELAEAINPSGLDQPRREKLADILVSSDPKKVCLELPETKAAKKLNLELSSEENLKRAEVLIAKNHNPEALEILKSDLRDDCRTAYLKALAYEGLRQYLNAKSNLKKATQLCEGDLKREALFLSAKLSSLSAPGASIDILDEFINAYPGHDYADDALLEKAHYLMALGKTSKANYTLELIGKKYPKGDIRSQALFERALHFVSENKLESALQILDQLQTDQADYWRGRLRLYPNLESFEVNPDLEQRAAGQKILSAYMSKKTPNYYSYFAAQFSKNPLNSSFKPETLPKSPLLNADPVYQSLLCLKQNKQVEQAVWVADRLAKTYTGQTEQILLAEIYLNLKRPDKAHQMMQMSGLSFPESHAHIKLAFPKAYEGFFKEAAKENKLPPNLLMGL